MKISWNEDKNEMLKKERGIGFEEIVEYMKKGAIIDIIQNPTREKQKYFLLNINNYIIVVPYVQHDDEIFLKTIFASRKYTKLYIGGKDEEDK